MSARVFGFAAATLLLTSQFGLRPAMCEEEVMFQDDFKSKLSPKWQVVGLKESDYRIRNGGLEMRVQSGKWSSKMPALNVLLPFEDPETVIVSAMAPTFRSALMVAVNEPVSSMPSRLTVAKPDSVNVTV